MAVPGRRSLVSRGLLAAALAAMLTTGCAGAAQPTPQIVYVTVTPAPTAAPSLTPIPMATPAPTAAPRLAGQADATRVAIADGSLGMTMAEFITRYNANLDQGQYPITATPASQSAQVYQVTPDDTTDTTILFVVNDDGTLRSVTALSTAAQKTDDIERSMAQLESLVVWSTVATAASPDASSSAGNSILGAVGLTGTQTFGTLSLTADLAGVRYYVIETPDATDLIIRQANN